MSDPNEEPALLSDEPFPPWIPVEQALPEYEVDVLTTDGIYCNVGQRYATGRWGEKWRLASEGDEDQEATQLVVAYWMRLPPLPPKQVKNV